MFGRREQSKSEKHDSEKFDPSEFRVHDRRVPRGVTVLVAKQEVQVLDLSEGGMRVGSPKPLPRVAVVEIFQDRQLVRTTAAVEAWARNGQTGYAFRSNQKLTTIESTRSKRLQQFLEPVDTNDTGGMSGSALRNRLKLK